MLHGRVPSRLASCVSATPACRPSFQQTYLISSSRLRNFAQSPFAVQTACPRVRLMHAQPPPPKHTASPSPSPSPLSPQSPPVSDHDMSLRVLTVPNAITLARVAVTPYMAWLFVSGEYRSAAAVFFALGLTDWLDGAIAKNFPGQRSVLGSYLDPFADKVLVNVTLVALCIQDLAPVWLTGLILTRDVGLVLGTVVHRFTTMTPPRTLNRFFRVSEVTFEVSPSAIGKLNTAATMLLLFSTIGVHAVYAESLPPPAAAQDALSALQYLVGAGTILSGGKYLLEGGKTFLKIRQRKP